MTPESGAEIHANYPTQAQGHQTFRTSWFMGISAYWYATSFKWFILLLVVLPGQVKEIVPGGEKGTYWGMVFAIGAGWAIIGPSLFGYLTDRLGGKGARKPFIAIGSALTVVALMLLAGADKIWVIIVGYLLLQISDDVGTGPYSALIPELVPEKQRGRASGMMAIFTLLAQISVGLLALALKGDVQKIYFSIAIVNIFCAAVVLFTLRGLERSPPKVHSQPFVAEFIKGWIDPWKSRDFFWVWFTRFLNAFGFYLVVNYLQYYLGDTLTSFTLFGKDLGTAGTATNMMAMAISLSGAAGAIYAGKAADRIGRKKVIYVGGTIMALMVVPAALIHDLSAIFLFATVFGVGYGMYLSADWALVSDVLPKSEDAGKDMGVWQMSNSVVQVFTGVSGALVDAGNRVAPGRGYTTAFMIASVAFLLSTILVRKVKGST